MPGKLFYLVSIRYNSATTTCAIHLWNRYMWKSYGLKLYVHKFKYPIQSFYPVYDNILHHIFHLAVMHQRTWFRILYKDKQSIIYNKTIHIYRKKKVFFFLFFQRNMCQITKYVRVRGGIFLRKILSKLVNRCDTQRSAIGRYVCVCVWIFDAFYIYLRVYI